MPSPGCLSQIPDYGSGSQSLPIPDPGSRTPEPKVTKEGSSVFSKKCWRERGGKGGGGEEEGKRRRGGRGEEERERGKRGKRGEEGEKEEKGKRGKRGKGERKERGERGRRGEGERGREGEEGERGERLPDIFITDKEKIRNDNLFPSSIRQKKDLTTY